VSGGTARGAGGLRSLRDVLASPPGRWGRATELGRVRMRSRLEKAFATHLFLAGEDYEYEPRSFGPRGSRYLPDFRIRAGGRTAYVEVKPTLAEVAEARTRMEVVWDDEPDALLMVACGEGCTFWAAVRGGEWVSWVERWAHR
jgi:hypothetical protein